MGKQVLSTHIIEAKKEGFTHWVKQPAVGKTDLFNVMREMMKDGYTEFKIRVIEPTPIAANQYS